MHALIFLLRTAAITLKMAGDAIMGVGRIFFRGGH